MPGSVRLRVSCGTRGLVAARLAVIAAVLATLLLRLGTLRFWSPVAPVGIIGALLHGLFDAAGFRRFHQAAVRDVFDEIHHRGRPDRAEIRLRFVARLGPVRAIGPIPRLVATLGLATLRLATLAVSALTVSALVALAALAALVALVALISGLSVLATILAAVLATVLDVILGPPLILLLGCKLALRLGQHPGVMFGMLHEVFCRDPVVGQLGVTGKELIFFDDLLGGAAHLALWAGTVEDAVDDIADRPGPVRL